MSKEWRTRYRIRTKRKWHSGGGREIGRGL